MIEWLVVSTEPPAQAKPTRIRWIILSLSFFTSALLYLHRYVLAYVKPMLAQEWGLTNVQLGQIDSAFAVFYAVFQVPAAILADVFGVHWVLGGLIFVWCLGFALMPLASSARWMWVAQAALGTGQSAVFACVSRGVRAWSPAKMRTTFLGIATVMGGRLGALASSLVFSTLLLGYFGLGWRTAVWILAVVGGLHFLAFVFLFRNSPRQHPKVNEAEAELIEGDESVGKKNAASPERQSIGKLLRSASPRSIFNLGFLGVQTALSSFADNIYSNWIPLFLVQVHHLQFQRMGIYAALPLLGGAIAGVFGGALNDFFIAKTGNRRWSRVGVGFCGKGIASLLMFAALMYYDQAYVFCIFLFFIKLFGDCSLATTYGVVTDIGGRATASVFAVNNTIATLGQIVAPLVLGYLADHYGWHAVFTAVAITYALCACSWFCIDCTIPVFREPVKNVP